MTPVRVAVVGSINRDLMVRCCRLPQPGQTVIADDWLESPGGKGANQAVATARLGAEVTMIGRIGNDRFGKLLLEHLSSEGVRTDHVQATDDVGTGLAVVTVEASGENSILVVPGANGRLTTEDVLLAGDEIRQADVLLLQLEVALPTVLSAIQIARRAGTLVILDPAPAVDEFPRQLFDVDFVCPNRSEAATFLSREINSLEEACRAAADLTALGSSNAIITMGDRGAVYCMDGEPPCLVSTPAVHVVDSTAAGDAFAGALAVSLAEGQCVGDAVTFACRAGALAATRVGAQVAMPLRRELESDES